MNCQPLPKSSPAFNRQSVQEALRSLKARLALYKKTPTNGLALFCGYHINDDGKERKLLIDIEPLLPLTHSMYKCDSQFHTEHLRAQLQEGGKFGFVVIDGHGVSFHVLAGNVKQTLYKWENVMLPKKHGRGGQSQNRFARIREEKRFNYITKVVALAAQYFIDTSTNQPVVSSLIMAGCADFKHDLAKRLDPRLQKIIASFVDIQYNGEAGFAQAIHLSATVLKDCRLVRELKVLETFFSMISHDGLFCFSAADTLYALEGGSLEKLIVWDGLADVRMELISATDANVKKIVYSHSGKISEADWVIQKSEPLLDWILDNYKLFGSEIELVSDGSSLGSQFAKGFGGIGGILRFPVEFPDRDAQGQEIEEIYSDDEIYHEITTQQFNRPAEEVSSSPPTKSVIVTPPTVTAPLLTDEDCFGEEDDEEDSPPGFEDINPHETHKEKKKRLEAEAKDLAIAKDDAREHLNVVMIGHVDAGKSTVSGQILYSTGMVSKRMIEQYQLESTKNNRTGWFLAYVMDTNADEMTKGITIEVGRAHFFTEKKRYTLLDAPGHNAYVPNMMAGLAQADVGVLVISARKGEFEAGMTGQTCEHAILAKTIGLKKLIILVNKMDDPTVEWQESRFVEIQTELEKFLRRIGFNPKSDLIWIPASGLCGTNIAKGNSSDSCSWYSGPGLLDALDSIQPWERLSETALRIPVYDKYKENGKAYVLSKVETGVLKPGDVVVSNPGSFSMQVQEIYNESGRISIARPGENVKLVVKCSAYEEDQIARGSVFCAPGALCPVTSHVIGEIKILQLSETKSLLTAGYTCIFHIGTTQEECVIERLTDIIDPKTKKSIEKNPAFAKEKAIVQCRIKLKKPLCVEKFSDFPSLGIARFTLRDEGRTIGFGKIIDFVAI